MKPIRVNLKERSYLIEFGSSAAAFVQRLRRLGFERTSVLLVTTQAVAKAGHAKAILARLRSGGFHPSVHVVPNGESYKTLDTLKKLLAAGLNAGLDRRSFVIAMGGGVVTDLAGFFAAVYMRGIPYVSIPTSLLAMVDAAIGGKTGVDLPHGKNLAGAFWQPKLVWIDPAYLRTLSERDWATGCAEIIKYGVIKDRVFFEWLEKKFRQKPLMRAWPSADITRAIYVSASAKAEVVSGDERERPLAGGREILNFGHTIGHALESAVRYRLSHGEAISVGMVAAGAMARRMGLWSTDAQLRLVSLLETVGLPIHFPRIHGESERLFWQALAKDKKHVSGSLRFVLPVKLGRVIVKSGLSPKLVKTVLEEMKEIQK